MMLEGPVAALRDLVRDSARSSKRINVLAHAGCDGLAAGAILARAVSAAGAPVTVRAVHNLEPGGIPGPVAVLADFGAGMASELDARLGESWAVLDHHRMPESEKDSPRVANPHAENFDDAQICSAGIAHMVAGALDAPGDARMAAVAALGDGHDSGGGRALTGEDGRIAAESGGVRAQEGLLLRGRTTAPVAAALARTRDPFMKGVTWDEEACADLVRGAGIKESDGGRMRTPADLSGDEISKLAGAVEKRAGVAPRVGTAYELPSEDPRGPLRDASEFAELLSACARRAPGAAISVCMGQRGAALGEAERVLDAHRRQAQSRMEEIVGQRWRVDGRGSCVVVNGDGVIPEEMTGEICSMMSSLRGSGGVVLLRAQDGERVKFSCRKAPGCGPEPDLHDLMSGAALACGGTGGGTRDSAAARVPKDKLDDFLRHVEGHVEVPGAGTS